MERKRHAAASALNHFRWLHKKPFWTVEPNKAKRRLKVRVKPAKQFIGGCPVTKD